MQTDKIIKHTNINMTTNKTEVLQLKNVKINNVFKTKISSSSDWQWFIDDKKFTLHFVLHQIFCLKMN